MLTTINAYVGVMEDHKRAGRVAEMRAVLATVKRRMGARSCGTEADREHWRRVWAAIAAYEEVCGEH